MAFGMTMSELQSPCIKVCVIEPGTGWCLGCGRTGAEIAAWPFLGAAERDGITAGLAARLKGLGRRPGRAGRRRLPSERRRQSQNTELEGG
jgi:predicted Fe-S protein YdhL (DUF1289 family)